MTRSPFERAEVVAGYEVWLDTPYGRWAERVELELVLELFGPLPRGARVLDLGCGTGRLAAHLAERGWRAVGLDPSQAMLERAARRVQAVCGDGLRLPFGDGAFDGVCVTSVLDYVDDPVALLREARRVARTRVAVVALAAGSWLAWRRRLQAARGHAIFGAARSRTRAELLELARAAGAEPERVRGAFFLPPSLAPRLQGLERRLARATTAGAGRVGFALAGLTTPRPSG